MRLPSQFITILLITAVAMSFFYSAVDAISFGNFNLGQKVTQKLAKPTFTPTTLQTCDVALG